MKLFDYEKKHLKTLRKSLGECTVLLKKNGEFPLEGPCRIAVYGSGVRHTVRGGTGSGEVNSRFFINVERGLQKAGFEITTGEWLDAYDEIRSQAKVRFIKEVKERARKKHTNALMEGMGAVMPEPEYDLPLCGTGDAALYILSRISGEGSDRLPVGGDVKLTETETQDILELNRRFRKFMLVLNVGGPVDLSSVSEAGNILVLSQLGSFTGMALADLLLGRTYPSGRLSATWASWEEYDAPGQFGEINDTRYREGIYVGYRYFDSVGRKALYPFGYGLGYTEFSVHAVTASAGGDRITVKASVTNTGSHAGREVVQVYVSVPEGKLDQPFQTLAGFVKTKELEPGETEQVSVKFRLSDLASYDEERSAYILEAGSYVIRAGSSSVDTTPAAVARLDREVFVKQVSPVGGKPAFADWKPERRPAAVLPESVPVLPIEASLIHTEMAKSRKPEEVDSFVKRLTDEQLAYLNTGAFDPKGGLTGIIGNAARTVAGAAGESCGLLKEQGFPALVMADGPAGLRLSPKFYRDQKGAHGVGQGGIPESMLDYLPAPVKLLSRLTEGSGKAPGKDVELEYQYATALPIGTALAQSWNTELAETCGDIVGDEMERFGVHLWLAPALNIQRSILCGRNFEYYSEDPLLSGRFAAAVTRGVQKHPGCGVTIKHFAANNQETNRYTSNSMVSERALREIYLRGFGICVREAQPLAVMTSYNLLNGEHTSERRDLIEGYLRTENGFRGIVMTDWIVAAMPVNKASRYRKPEAWRIAAAGSELVMPGSKKDYESIRKALETGSLSRKQLELNVTRLYRMARRLTGE